MRYLLAVLMAVGAALVVTGAVVPELFVLSLVGLVVLFGTASFGLAGVMHSTRPRVHY